MAKYGVWKEDGETKIFPMDALDVIDIPSDLVADVREFIDDEDPDIEEIVAFIGDGGYEDDPPAPQPMDGMGMGVIARSLGIGG